MDAVLELRSLTKHFPGHRAVEEVAFQIARGELFSLVGPSGCGKTTTLRLIAGFEQPDSGEILLNGRIINRLRPYERRVSTVFQNYALFPHLTVRGNVEFGLRRMGASDIDHRVREALDLVQLAGKESRYPAQLSGGERQRTALARSLVVKPDLLLLDEPLSALDPNLRGQVRAEMRSLQRRTGVAFLLVTHDQEEALSISDRIAVMHQGRIEQVGTPREVYLRPASRFVAGFLGAVNWINGAAVRPEALRITRQAPPAETRSVTASVTEILFLGSQVRVTAQLHNGAVVVAELSRVDASYNPGEQITLWWDPSEEMHLDMRLPGEAP